jgi:Stress responsive A/B Barrel Domain
MRAGWSLAGIGVPKGMAAGLRSGAITPTIHPTPVPPMKHPLRSTLLIWLFTAFCALGADGPYRHIVMFKFKEDASPAAVREVEKAFAALPKQIPSVTGFEWGTNVSPEGKADGFTHCFTLTFRDKAGLEAYLPHPEHKKFGAMLKGLIDKVLVIDYVAKDA